MNTKKIFSKFFLVATFVLIVDFAFAQSYKAYVNAGEKYFQGGDYYSAKNYFQQALEFENADLEIKYKTAESSRLFNDYYAASVYYTQTIEDDKDHKFPLALS